MPLPDEWLETSNDLEVLWQELTVERQPITARVDGDMVVCSIIIPKEEASELLDWSARYDDHECENGWQAILDFHERIMEAFIAAASYTGDLVGDSCEDEE